MDEIGYENEIKEWKEFANLLEKNSFGDLKKLLGNLKITDSKKYNRFFADLDEVLLWATVSRQKVELALFVSDQVKVKALPEDTTRIVTKLSRLYGKDINEVNKVLQKEFGDYFIFPSVFVLSNRKISYKEVIMRAREIINGLKNICYLEIEDDANEILVYFKANNNNGQEELLKLEEVLFRLMAEAQDVLSFTNINNYKELKPQLIELYKLTHRTDFDIKTLDDPDFNEIAKFIYFTAEIVSIKLNLISKNYPPNDIVQARTMVFNDMANKKFQSRISAEEILRTGLPLPRIRK